MQTKPPGNYCAWCDRRLGNFWHQKSGMTWRDNYWRGKLNLLTCINCYNNYINGKDNEEDGNNSAKV